MFNTITIVTINSLLNKHHNKFSKHKFIYNSHQHNNNCNNNHKYQNNMTTKFIKIEYYVRTQMDKLVTEEMFINPTYIESIMIQKYDGMKINKLKQPQYMLLYLNKKYELTEESFRFLYDTFVSNDNEIINE